MSDLPSNIRDIIFINGLINIIDKATHFDKRTSSSSLLDPILVTDSIPVLDKDTLPIDRGISDHDDLNKCEILYVAKSANFTIKCPFKSENGTVVWSGPPNLNTYSDKETVSSKVKGIGIIGDSANGEYTLIIYGFDEPNEGLYQCSAVFDKKPIMYAFEVLLQTRQPTISMNISPSESIIEGTNVLIECKARNNPSPSLLKLNGPDGNILNFTGNPDKEQMLRFTLSDIKRKDIGYYTCTARNSKANRTVSVLLNILYSPTVTITGRNFSNIEPVRNLDCVALGNPNTYKYKQWEHSFYGQHIRFLSGLKNGTLVLPFINKREHRYEDSGSYRCFVGNDIPDGDFYQTADIFIQTKGV
ncbi:opioid-binding protein/cell adhesion molecule-like [Mytilus galloprovincialis]|uniref:opioid-binding protein/cell adhesion molecule-like n=1 Tax=Mytilus galloprovincialis TaxID=29158 RepID=UPI003F7BE71A